MKLIEVFTSKKEIEAYRCCLCGALRTSLEWETKGKANCICGSNKVTPTYPNALGRAKLLIRYAIKGY